MYEDLDDEQLSAKYKDVFLKHASLSLEHYQLNRKTYNVRIELDGLMEELRKRKRDNKK